MTRKILISLFCFLLVSFGVGGNVYVTTNGPSTDPYDTWAKAATNIEWAVNVGTNDDTVWISNGTYYLTNQITVNSNITIIGTGGVVVVNGNNANRCFYFTNTVNQGGVLSNLFITGGYTNDHGGGLWMLYGMVYDCIFSNNVCTSNGGGMYFAPAGTGAVRGCTFIDNRAYEGGGLYVTNTSHLIDDCLFHTNIAQNVGGMYAHHSGTIITNCDFTCNVASNTMGGAYVRGTMFHCTIASNIAVTGSYGGVYVYGLGGGGVLSNCYISNNIAGGGNGGGAGSYYASFRNCVIARNKNLNLQGNTGYGTGGGGIYPSYSTVQDCIIEENTGEKYGGGVKTVGSTLKNCLIRNNVAGGYGGGVFKYSGSANILSCTIVSNYASAGGGLYDIVWVTKCICKNSIIYLNQASGTTSNYDYYYTSTCTSSFENCCLAPALSGSVTTYSSNNITADPQFVDWTSGNYRLRANSPCVNTGVNEDWMTNAVDLEGTKRIRYGTVDMGAYEKIYEGTIYRIP